MAHRETKISFRPLLPATKFNPANDQQASHQKRKRQTIACAPCQIKRTKCSGSSPCVSCTETGSLCYYEPNKDKRRKEALKKCATNKKSSNKSHHYTVPRK
ncbi:hypothetical protein ASPSYDRAFT_52603 [Aspergillus sydowii CBS 593.65]|uniref:Zn(2)-C6 fungal-type domain-containing protein n=1 Tax=Aspergillus sydowii CBS 593.65 TaxID=1036612 RepID=A0A1L9SXR1_9EURO|nr:uncharacterized protein ASPSYDRAFT_52603 [Aspergillus sydowii CBS 593.65]OJJ51992.1 hypothetical protein ASPSYDRAFT_52603 [Aspergillus sydowii CBS 593.65]